MEIMATTATTNNHNQKELRLYAPNEQQQQQQTANATALASGARSPFQREVREWQRIDPDTGALLTGRLEADRWINGPLNKYGKISDSQNISQPNGTQQTQRKQLEVLQTCTPTGGAMQVIRSQTVQTTSSRWSTSSASASASPLLLTANNTSNNTSPITTQMQKNKQKMHTSNDYSSSSSITNSTTNANTSPSSFTTPSLLSNGFNHHHQQHLQQHYKQLEQLRQQHKKFQQFPNSFANGFSHSKGSKSHNRNWPDLTKNMSTLDICDNEHDHDNDYIVEQQSTDDDGDDGDGDGDNNRRRNTRNHNDSLLDYNEHNDDDDHDDHNSDHQYLLTKLNNLKNVDLNKRHSLTVFPNDTANNYDRHDHNHDSHHNHQYEHNHSYGHNNLSRDSSSGSCSGVNNSNTNSGNNHNNNQLFLLDTAPSLKLSNLMKSSSSLSNSSNNSTTASQATTVPSTTTTTMNTHKTLANNKVSLHAIVGSGSNNHMTTATTTTSSTTPSPTLTTATQRSSWQQPTLYRQNSNGNATHSHLMKTRVGDNNNGCCSRSGGGVCRSSSVSSCDESRSYAANKTETALRHLQQQQQQQHHIHHVKQNDRLTPTHLPHSYQRVDLESFRHYNNNDNTNTNTNNNNNNINNNDTDDDGLRLSNRHLRRQQIPYDTNSLQRSRSISTDDLSTEWDVHGGDTEEPAEWRRVSKLRRSFQSTTQKNESYSSPVTIKRPLDLPASSVSVSRIRAELENGRRLNTVMRNNHVDLAALSSILNGNNDKDIKSPLASKRDTFLTAESLKEIRGKLKKLSDESLYKEDFIISQQNNDANPEVEHIVNDQTKVKATYGGRKTPERYRVVTKTEENNNKHTTNSLESRVKYKDTNSVDWHTRRKSYGFEKMSPPEKAMLRMDASTDSGLGRSGELQNWSPTSENSNANRTVVRFGDTGGVNKPPVVQRRYKTQKSYEESENSLEEDTAVTKRHSIAVDESQYVRDNARQTTQIRLNGFHEPGSYTKFVQSTESTTTTDRGQQKRVEFSKTEVHFATESGRVNIVETDSKPPPTNNFRRRRSRSSSVGPLQSLVKSATTVSTTAANNSTVAMPVTLFGDDSTKVKKTLASTTVAYRAPLVGSPEPSKDNGINVTVTIPAHTESYAFHESSRSSYASTSGVDTTDCDTDEMTSLRGILKNKPAKPKPYVLGENIDKPDDLWGVQLKPVNGNQMKTERAYKSESPTLIATTPQKSVAERIQELGSASTQANGFSTKINVSMGSALANANNWEDNGLITSSQRQRATNAQQLLMHDLKEHQKILDEGLKSTTLIIKTLRSANEFDEAMRRLSMGSIEETPSVKPPLMLRSNSYQESSHSLDYKEFAENDVKNIYKSTSFSSTSSWSTIDSMRKCSQDSRKTSTDSGASCAINGSTPRLSFLGNEQIPVSQQLQRLRLIYDAAANRSQDEDSADEEVKSYFKENIESDSGGGTQDSSSYEDEHCLESSNSWSRLKAKKTIWKIDTDTLSNSGVRSLKKSLDKTDLPKSNVMSIKLHSPQAQTVEQPPLKVVPPLAKPRTITLQESAGPKVHTATTVKQAPYKSSLPTKDSLKIVKEARGARQLREHELSYFGVPVSSTSEDEKPKTKYTATTASFRNSPKRSLPLRKLSEESTTSTLMAMETEQQREQWQLESDKPDLLKHNPIDIKPIERSSLKKKAQLDEEDEHLYENIANDITPVFKVKAATPPLEQYDRKTDLKRDFEILNEMNQNADQTLKELSDEAALKDRRRRSLQRRNSKPLETIDEKSIAERINDSCIAVKISRSTYASKARKSSRHSTPSPSDAKRISSRERSSSQSSVECCPRARSRSLSSEKEYDVTKSKTARTTHMVKHKTVKPTQSRSSSLDSQRSSHSQYSSGDEPQPRSSNSFRREDRSRTKTKRTTSSTLSSTREKQREEKTNIRSVTSSRHNHNHGDTKRLSSTTPSTTHRERVECKHDNSAGTATTRHHSSSSIGLQRSTAATSSGRRQKDDIRDSQRMKRTSTLASGRTTTERHDKQVTRSLRDDERNSSQRSSSHRLERNDKDKEKDKTSRSSKGHSSRSTSHQHHERTTKPEKHTKETKTKSTALATHETNTTSSKNATSQQYHQHPSQHNSKERHERQQHRSKRDEQKEQQQQQAEHVHGLKSAIIKTTTKLRDKSRSKKEKK